MKKKSPLVFIVIAAAVVIVVYLFLGGNNMEHIEDLNGPDDYTLAVITEEEITAKGLKNAKGGPNTSVRRGSFMGIESSSGTLYHSKRFSGIYSLASWNLIGKSDLVFDIYNFEVTAGNFLMCVVHDGEIIGTIEPGHLGPFLMEDVEPGYYEVVIAGESAAFEFTSFNLAED